MSASEERLELVSTFASLRPGMIIVFKPCNWCGGKHRALLTSMFVGTGVRPDGTAIVDCAAFGVQPNFSCQFERAGIGEAAVQARKIWRVVDGLTDADATTTHEPTPARKLEPVR